VGVHTSIAGGLAKAADRARKLGCETFQIFSANPRTWATTELDRNEISRFRESRARYQLSPLIVHDNYLINLASSDRRIREKSIAALRREIARTVALGAEYLVTHPGSPRRGEAGDGIRSCSEALCQAAKGTRFDGLKILIENTAGQGSALGASFEELAEIIQGVHGALPVGVCLDTAHCFEAGYPIHTASGLEATLAQLQSAVGLDKLYLIHANDSKTPLGSRADRHQHIGKGEIGAEAFGRILRHPALRALPFICETPMDHPGADRRNLRMMRKLAATP